MTHSRGRYRLCGWQVCIAAAWPGKLCVGVLCVRVGVQCVQFVSVAVLGVCVCGFSCATHTHFPQMVNCFIKEPAIQ